MTLSGVQTNFWESSDLTWMMDLIVGGLGLDENPANGRHGPDANRFASDGAGARSAH